MATQQDIEDYLRQQGGISDEVIKEESPYLMSKYGDQALSAAGGAVGDYRKRSEGSSSSSSQQVDYGGGGDGGNSGPYPDWYRGIMERTVAQQEADRAKNTQRADDLYGTLMSRANQSLAIDRNSPMVRQQSDIYGANTDRSARNYISDLAEQRGPLANIQNERRLTAEKAAQGKAGFEAELIGRELQNGRDEISQALAQQGSILSGDQNRNLQQQLGQMGQALGEAGINNQSRGLDIQQELGRGGLDLQRLLGVGGLTLQGQGLAQNQDQFLRELGLRQWQLGDESDYRWANL